MSLPAMPAPAKKSSRGIEYAIILAVIGVVAAAAFFQEPLTAYFKLRLWDRDGPGRTVVNFLKAGKSGDRTAADRQLAGGVYQPFEENGRWKGYFIVTQAGRMNIDFADIAPAGEPKPTATQFITIGDGASEVQVPDAQGQPITYRLEMKADGWKITEIRGGRPAQQPAPAPRSGGSRSGAARGGGGGFRPPGP